MTSETDIAVIGIGCRFPDAWTPQEFWRNIDNGVTSMRELTPGQLEAAGVSKEAAAAPDFVSVATTLPGVEEFASEFFGYPPREADTIDPQQRIFLECAWEALEAAGHPPRDDGPLIGVFGSSYAGTYSAALLTAKARDAGLRAAIDDLELTVGGQPDFMTSRTAYKLGLRGPAVSIQTGCSSSLYALHYATLSLLSGECDIALAGGVTVHEPLRGYRHQPGGVVSEDGYCRSFDADSTGTTHSSGIGVVAVRRLSDALADGDNVLAVIRGSAVGNDGGQRLGYVSPSPSGVADVVSAALKVAEVPAERFRYVEAHGTATAVGDHIELLALSRALGDDARAGTGSCALGSVMTNIGHTGPAAGIAGLIKAVHVARTGAVPPHPTFRRPRDPDVLAESPFYVPTTAQVCAEPDRHVLVNSIGVGGTNAAVVLAPPPQPSRPSATAGERVRLVLSARTRAELDAASRRLADALEEGEAPVADVAHTLRVGRHAFTERRVVEAPPAELAAALRLPRPPAARTVRAEERRAVVVPPPEGEAPTSVVDRLLAALPSDTEVARAPEEAPSDAFAILVGHGASGDGRHHLPVEDREGAGSVAERVDAALAAAWLHGVAVDWRAAANGDGRRVPLPTYPFTRRRHWALDRLAPFDEESAPAPAPTSAPAEPAGSVEEDIAGLWREYFGLDTVGVDDEFGALGGTSLLSVQMVLEIQKRHGVLVNVHRAGGSKATVRRIAEIVRGMREGAEPGSDVDPVADGDGAIIDRDLQLPLGPMSPKRAPGRDVLLTGATGYLGAFLLRELLATTKGRVYCLVRAADEEAARERLREAAARFRLPEPDPERVHPVVGDFRDIGEICRTYRDGELAGRVGHVVHCGARVVFTEPYRVLREDNVLPMIDLLRWMRGHGIRDFSFVSTLAATDFTPGSDGRLLETRDQPLAQILGGYGVSKWVGERILDRADEDGMRSRVFRPGLIMAASDTGACNDKDLIWFVLAGGLAVGAHPADDRAIPVSPVDVLAKGIAELAMSSSSVGRAYHLVDERAVSMSRLFGLLAEAGLPTRPMEYTEWQRLVADEALRTGSSVLSAMAAYELEGIEAGENGVQARAWQTWLRRRELSPSVTGEQLRNGLVHLARQKEEIAELLPALAAEGEMEVAR